MEYMGQIAGLFVSVIIAFYIFGCIISEETCRKDALERLRKRGLIQEKNSD